MVRRALISVYDKTGLAALGKGLAALGFEIVSTGGTLQALREADVPAVSVSEVTGFPEILDGRVKTLHPAVHAGILARRDRPSHMRQLEELGLGPIDVVVNNLYPFRETARQPGVSIEDAIENIDIGGPSMIRAAAKNFEHVLVVVDPADYNDVLDALRTGDAPVEWRRKLAVKAFQHTATYDTLVAQYLRGHEDPFPEEMTIALRKRQTLRYGENPHQEAAFYADEDPREPALTGMAAVEQLHGKELSYLNIFDADAAYAAACDFTEPTVVIVKHGTPSGIASHADVAEAYRGAFACDTMSPYGGIIGVNCTITEGMAAAMKGVLYDVIIAPEYEPAALERLQRRKDLRILRAPLIDMTRRAFEFRKVAGGVLVQEADRLGDAGMELRCVTRRAPTEAEMADLLFAWRCVKHVKSNAIVLAKDRRTVGIGGGQPNRKAPVDLALHLAGDRAQGAVMASDAFFPFARGDAVEIACQRGVRAIIQPGGSIRDQEAIEIADQYHVAMIFTGVRHFKH
jgi:phosphoribosylaminoimidazolecarboxamide formyltransferase/IMP cyclohydrolase